MSVDYADVPPRENLSLAEEDLEAMASHGPDLLMIGDITCYTTVVTSVLLNGFLFFAFCKNNLIWKYGIHFNILITDVINTVVFIYFSFRKFMVYNIGVWKMWEFVTYFDVYQRIFSVIALSTHRTFIIYKFPSVSSALQFNFTVQSSNYIHTFIVWSLSFVFPIFLINLKEHSSIAELMTSEITVLPLLPIGVLVSTFISCSLLQKIDLKNVEDDRIKESFSEYTSSKVVTALTVAYTLNFLPSFLLHTIRLFAYIFELVVMESHLHWYFMLHRVFVCINFVSHPIIVLVAIKDFKKLVNKCLRFRKQTEVDIYHDLGNDVLLQEVGSDK